MEKHKVVKHGIIIILLCIGVVFWMLCKSSIIAEEIFVNCSIGLISLVISVVSACFVVIELQESKGFQEAEFIVNLNQAFVNNDHYAETYSKLENVKKEDVQFSNVEISNYLTFFETTFLLLEKKVITIETMDDLFGYRFFLAVHNTEVQRLKLVKSPYNFRNIYHLEKIWMDYRKKKGLTIYGMDNTIEKACERNGISKEYQEIMRTKKRGENK